MNTYSFLDIQATLSGPGGVISLGSGAGSAEEGLTVEAIEETDTMMIGAGGEAMHSLHASKAAKVTVRLLKTSPVNAALHLMYNFQRASGRNHGKNTMSIVDTARGDNYTFQDVAFSKLPGNTYGKEGNVIEWEFNAGAVDGVLGIGL